LILEHVLWKAGVAAEAALLAILLYRRTYKAFPVFCLYIAWCLVSDLADYYVNGHFRLATITATAAVDLAITSLFQVGVLLEVSRSVLRPMAKFLPRWTLPAIGLLIVAIVAAVWPLAKIPGSQAFNPASRLLIHFQQSFSILIILFFLVLAGCSQLLSIGWKDRELQIATGLGVYSMTSLAVALMHTHQSAVSQYRQYHLLDNLQSGVYFCSLSYWVFSFLQQEAERREFTPQMQSFLLAVAGSARSARLDLKESEERNNRKRDR
jgi:hypothetical protein